jgi:hypothetical protein
VSRLINGATAKLIFNILIAYCEQRDGIELTCDDCAIKSRCRAMRHDHSAPTELDPYPDKETKGANLEGPFDD